jgi:hypothetical protein
MGDVLKTHNKKFALAFILALVIATSGCSQNQPLMQPEEPQVTSAPSPTFSDAQLDEAILEVLGKTIDLAPLDFSETRVKDCSDYIFISNAEKDIHPVLQYCLDDSKLAIELLDSSTSQVIKDARDALDKPRLSEEYQGFLGAFIGAPDSIVREAPQFKKLCTRSNITGKFLNEKATECGVSMIKIMTFTRLWGEGAYDYTNR